MGAPPLVDDDAAPASAGPPPPRGRSGRFGLLPPLAMVASSVKAPQLRPDADLLSKDAREPAAPGRALEAREAAAGVGAAARLVPAGHEDALAGREPQQLALRRAPAAAGAAPHRLARYDSSSAGASTSIGIPPVASSSVATADAARTVSRSTSPSASATATASGP